MILFMDIKYKFAF